MINTTNLLNLIKKFRAVVFGTIALFLYLFGYKNARESAENQKNKEENNAIKKAQEARRSLSNPDRIERLHNKYKR